MPLKVKYSKNLFLIVALLSFAFADNEFIIESFKALPNDMAGSVYAKKDGNNEFCGLIKVKTGIREELAFDSGLKFSPSEKKNPGEYWVYVSPGEGRLTLMAEGFIPKHFQISTVKIESKRTYEMVVRAKEEEKIPVVILTDPPDAEKWLDGELLGLGDGFFVSLGRHELMIKKKGYYDFKEEIEVSLNKFIFKDIKLREIVPLDITISTTPNDAEVYINKTYRGKSNIKLSIIPGEHIVRITKNYYYDVIDTITVREAASSTYSFSLIHKTGVLMVNANPMDAIGSEIYVDGEMQKEKTPAEINLPVGAHTVTIKHKGFLDNTQKNVIIKENDYVKKEFEMKTYSGSLKQKEDFWKKQKWIALGSTIIIGGVGGIGSNYLGWNKYSAYNNALTIGDVIRLRNESESYFLIRDISYGLSISTLVYSGFALIQELRYKEYQKNGIGFLEKLFGSYLSK